MPLPLASATLIEMTPCWDDRGIFVRFFCQEELKEHLEGRTIVQINFSKTRKKWAIRGMHFQYPPKAEVKMVRCLRGAVYDVIVDLRQDSPTFLQWHAEELTAENMHMLYIPEGFAHGFQTLTEDVEMLYLHTAFYAPEYEGGLYYADPALNIAWPFEPTEISDRDKQHSLIDKDFTGIAL